MNFFQYLDSKISSFKYKYIWLILYDKKVLFNIIEDKVDELAKNENIKIFSVPYEEMNSDVSVEKDKAVGTFHYQKSKKIREEHEELFQLMKKVKKLVRQDYLPRIEISEKGDVYTKIHELGHYFLYKREQKQSEEGANMFIEEFFDKYLPPFFKWIYRIEIKIRTKKELNFSSKENYLYYQEYKKYIKDHGIQ